MRSKLPKVLHPCLGEPLISYPVQLAIGRGCSPVVVVVGPDSKRLQEFLTARFSKIKLKFAVQQKPLGTADAVKAGLEEAGPAQSVLILNGDLPLLRSNSLAKLSRALARNDGAFLTAHLDDPHGYGRVLRDDGRVVGVVEHKDASTEQRSIQEVNAGVYLFRTDILTSAIKSVNTKNSQGEFYLPDVIAHAANGKGVVGVELADSQEILGVNNHVELARAQAIGTERLVEKHQLAGVRFAQPHSVVLHASVKIAPDVSIGPSVQMYGDTKIGEGACNRWPQRSDR